MRRRRKSEPRIVNTFRAHYPDSVYLDLFDNGIKVGNGARKPVNEKWLLRNMKIYHRLNKDNLKYKKVKGLLRYA